MSGSTNNNLVNPAVGADVSTLLIEKFNGVVHEQYLKGENLLSGFTVQDVVGTNIVSDKYMGETSLQTLTPGQEPEATNDTEFNKNALVVDTIVLGRNTVHTLHDIQNDFDVMTKLATNQTGKIKTMEDQMVVQQLLATGLTGGVYDPYANTITGGISRVTGQGVAIEVGLKDDDSQAQDPYQLVSAIEISLMGLVTQRVPIAGLKVLVPIAEFGLLVDYGFIAQTEGGSNEATGTMFDANLSGRLKGWGLPVQGSVEFTQMKINPHDGLDHSLLSNANNGNRYDVTDDMKAANAIIYQQDALLCGRTIALSTDIFFDQKTKGYFIDSWLSEGATTGRYDNCAVVVSNSASADSNVLTKAKGKAKATKTYS
jgi:hypothetical protein